MRRRILAGGGDEPVSVQGWQLSSKTLDGYTVYESYESYHVNNAKECMVITVQGLYWYTFKVRNFSQSAYDYVVVSNVDDSSTPSAPGTTPTVGTGLASAGKVLYSNKGKSSSSTWYDVNVALPDKNQHKIYVWYVKNASTHSNDDKGYCALSNNVAQFKCHLYLDRTKFTHGLPGRGSTYYYKYRDTYSGDDAPGHVYSVRVMRAAACSMSNSRIPNSSNVYWGGVKITNWDNFETSLQYSYSIGSSSQGVIYKAEDSSKYNLTKSSGSISISTSGIGEGTNTIGAQGTNRFNTEDHSEFLTLTVTEKSTGISEQVTLEVLFDKYRIIDYSNNPIHPNGWGGEYHVDKYSTIPAATEVTGPVSYLGYTTVNGTVQNYLYGEWKALDELQIYNYETNTWDLHSYPTQEMNLDRFNSTLYVSYTIGTFGSGDELTLDKLDIYYYKSEDDRDNANFNNWDPLVAYADYHTTYTARTADSFSCYAPQTLDNDDYYFVYSSDLATWYVDLNLEDRYNPEARIYATQD